MGWGGTNIAATPGRFIADGVTVAVTVKTGAGILRSLAGFTIATWPFYITMFDAAADPGAGGTSVQVWGVPAAGTAANGNGDRPFLPPQGIAFNKGCILHIHTAIADSDQTAVGNGNGIVSWSFS